MKKLYTLILVCAALLFALVFFTLKEEAVHAESSAYVDLLTINNGYKKEYLSLGMVNYDSSDYAHHFHNEVSGKSLNQYLNEHNCTTVRMYDEAGYLMRCQKANGVFMVPLVDGIVRSVSISEPLVLVTYHLDNRFNSTLNPDGYYKTTSTIFSLGAPIRPGYEFSGWYTDPEFTNYITSINTDTQKTDIHLYARWTKIYKKVAYLVEVSPFELIETRLGVIEYFYDLFSDIYRISNQLNDYKNAHNKSKMYFLSTEGALVPITSSFSHCLASIDYGAPEKFYVQDDYYTINYHLNEGNFDTPSILYYKNKDELSQIKSPVRDGYQFLGWHKDENCQEELFPILSSFVETNLNLYPLWSQIFTIPVIHKWTDSFVETIEEIDSVIFYEIPPLNRYVFSNNLLDKKTLLNKKQVVYSENDDVINIISHNGEFISSTQFKPDKIIIKDDYYKITYSPGDYVLPDRYLKYYTSKSELINNLPKATRPNFRFIGWATNELLDEVSFTTSSFDLCDIILYPNFSELFTIAVYQFDSSKLDGNYTYIGESYYYKYSDELYCFGELTNYDDGVGYYLKNNDCTSFNVLDENDEPLQVFTNNGFCLSLITQATPKALNIYKHYSVKFYVNGICAHIASGNIGERIVTPDFIIGYIGKNYDAVDIFNTTIGNRFAIYLFKNWSTVDTSDKTWFDKTKVDFIEDWSIKEGDPYVKNVYAYMSFYKKLSEKNTNINYDEYIRETKGIITSSSRYTIDDLAREHVTEISSGTHLSVPEKIGKALGISPSHPIADFFNNITASSINMANIWKNAIGKILIILISITTIIICIIIVRNIRKIKAA